MTAEAALKNALAKRGNTFAVLDASREPAGVHAAKVAGGLCKSLYEGSTGERLRQVAPYLVEFRTASSFARWWFDAWGKSAGIIVETSGSFADVRKHCRTLMIVRGQDQAKYYFRFYDPRVLRTYLPTLAEAEAERFFGLITAVHCEGTDGAELITYRPGEKGVTVKRNIVNNSTR